MKYKILSTKKLDPSVIDYAKQNDIEIIELEFISIKPISSSDENLKQVIELIKKEIQYVVFTSSNAVISITDIVKSNIIHFAEEWKIFCLSGKTKEAILNLGFLEKNIAGMADNAAALAKKIIEQDISEVIFCCGNKRKEELPSLLKKAGIKVHEIIVYETIETPTVATIYIDAILFFSPSAVHSFFSVNKLKKNTVCFAIGQTTADSIADLTDNKIIVSEFPGQEMLIASVQNYFQNINCHE